MPQVEVAAGVIEYADSGGAGPVVVLFGGLAIGPSLWNDVVDHLAPAHRCIVLTLPWGAHRLPMREAADLSLEGHARIVVDVVEALGLRDVTLVENDTGMLQLIAGDPPAWLAGIVLTSCEAFSNYPPGLPGKVVGMIGKLPGGIWFAAQQLRIRPLRRSPLMFGLMSRKPIPHEMFDGWIANLLAQRAIRRDLTKYIRAVDRKALVRASERLGAFDRPALVVWGGEDRVMPIEHGRRLAELLPQGRLETVEGSRTLIPIDAPEQLAGHIAAFVAQSTSTVSDVP